MLNYTWRSAGSFVAPSSVSVTSSHRDVYQDKWVKKMCYIIQWNIGLCLVTQSYPTLCDPMDCSLPDFSDIGFSRQEYWSGLPFPSPGDLPDPGIEPRSPVWATVEYCSAIKNEIISFAATWIWWEIIMLSEEIRKRKTNTMWYHLCVESKNMIHMNLFTKQKLIHRLWKQTYGYQGECWGERWTGSLELRYTHHYVCVHAHMHTLLYIK